MGLGENADQLATSSGENEVIYRLKKTGPIAGEAPLVAAFKLNGTSLAIDWGNAQGDEADLLRQSIRNSVLEIENQKKTNTYVALREPVIASGQFSGR